MQSAVCRLFGDEMEETGLVFKKFNCVRKFKVEFNIRNLKKGSDVEADAKVRGNW